MKVYFLHRSCYHWRASLRNTYITYDKHYFTLGYRVSLDALVLRVASFPAFESWALHVKSRIPGLRAPRKIPRSRVESYFFIVTSNLCTKKGRKFISNIYIDIILVTHYRKMDDIVFPGRNLVFLTALILYIYISRCYIFCICYL